MDEQIQKELKALLKSGAHLKLEAEMVENDIQSNKFDKDDTISLIEDLKGMIENQTVLLNKLSLISK